MQIFHRLGKILATSNSAFQRVRFLMWSFILRIAIPRVFAGAGTDIAGLDFIPEDVSVAFKMSRIFKYCSSAAKSTTKVMRSCSFEHEPLKSP